MVLYENLLKTMKFIRNMKIWRHEEHNFEGHERHNLENFQE